MTSEKSWKCEVCGYIHTGTVPPDTCPVCGASKDQFSEIAIEPISSAPSSNKWRCTVCGYAHEGVEAPDSCPVCGVPKALFSPLEEPEGQKKTVVASETVVVLGDGVAGVTAAETAARASGNQVKLVSKEPGMPYFRLNLTRYLAGEVSGAELEMKSAAWFEETGIERVEGDVTEIVPSDRTLKFRDGRILNYDRLVITAGSHPFIPPITGINKQGALPLRTKGDADNILSEVTKETKCVIIGGGLLGLESAGALLRRGCDVTVLEGYGWLLPRQLPKPAGVLLGKILTAKGLNLRLGATTKEIVGDDHVRGVVLNDGTEIPADLVVVSTGVRPNTYLARQCGLNVGNGIIVNDRLCTSDSNIYAAGDVCEHRGTLYGIWPAAYLQGMVAGSNAVGQERKFTGIPRSNRLKVFDVDLFSIGTVNPEDASHVVFEHQEDQNYHRLIIRDGRLTGAVFIGDTSFAGRIQEAIEAGTQLKEWPELKERFVCLKEQ